MEDDLGQVLLSFDPFSDSVRDVRDHVGQDELGEVNNVLRGEEEDTFMNSYFHSLLFVSKIFSVYTHLYNNYKSHFGSDHMPVTHTVLILPGMPGWKPKIPIPKKEIFLNKKV